MKPEGHTAIRPDPSLDAAGTRSFALQEGDLLRRVAEALGAESGAVLHLVAPTGEVVWSSGGEVSPGAAPFEQPLKVIEGMLRLYDPRPGGDSAAGPWLRSTALLLDSVAARAKEMLTLIDEHIALTDQLLAVYNIVRETRAQLSLDDQLREVLREAVRVSGMAGGVLWLSGPPAERLMAASVAEGLLEIPDALRSLATLPEQPSPQAVAAASSGRFHGCAHASVQVGKDRSGNLWLLSGDPERPILARELKLASAMADLISTYLETASLQEIALKNLQVARELEIAHSIQHLLVPRELEMKTPHKVAACYHPARDVGGDFYLALPLEDGRLLFALGDVVGKGVPAALLMSMTRTAVMSLATEFHSPGLILRRLAQILHGDLDRTGKFVTLVLAFHEPASRSITVANAGHSPVYLFRPARGFERLDPAVPPLGIFPDLDVPDQRYAFEDGDLLLAMTDGFTEARDQHGDFLGTDQFESVLRLARASDPRAFLEDVVSAVSDFEKDAPQADDQTALILQGGFPK